jgi:competence protein ComFC
VRLYCSCTQPSTLVWLEVYEAGGIRLGGSRRKTWRVVFSSTGDLTPESYAAPHGGLRAHAWLVAASRPLRVVVDSLAAGPVPSDCRICNQPLAHLSRISVCDQRLNSLNCAEIDSCSTCGKAPEFQPSELITCGICRRVPPRFDFALPFAGHDGSLRRLVHLLEHEQLRPAVQVLSSKLACAIEESRLESDQPVLVVPVPLHRGKLCQRGRFELHVANLRRVRATDSKTGPTRHRRRENARAAFTVTAPERMKRRSSRVVSDVYTTGTTLNECACVVRAEGATQSVVATFARVYLPAAKLVLGVALNQEGSASVLAGAAAG